MRATILVTTTPGGGPDVVDAVEDDDRFDRALVTLGPFEAARKAHPTVEDAYPLLGRFDDAIWLAGEDLAASTGGLRAVQALDGVADTLTFVEAHG